MGGFKKRSNNLTKLLHFRIKEKKIKELEFENRFLANDVYLHFFFFFTNNQSHWKTTINVIFTLLLSQSSEHKLKPADILELIN